MSSIELKPCPFCGGNDIKAGYDRYFNYGYVLCRTCRAEVWHKGISAKKEAIDKWNRRSDNA